VTRHPEDVLFGRDPDLEPRGVHYRVAENRVFGVSLDLDVRIYLQFATYRDVVSPDSNASEEYYVA